MKKLISITLIALFISNYSIAKIPEGDCGYFFYVETFMYWGSASYYVRISEIKGRYSSIRIQDHPSAWTFETFGPYESYEQAKDARRGESRRLFKLAGKRFEDENSPSTGIKYHKCK